MNALVIAGIPRIDPQDVILQPGHQIRVAGQAKAHQVESDRLALVGHADVDMAEFDDVAEVFRGPVKGGRDH